jgi:hypothetical protein
MTCTVARCIVPDGEAEHAAGKPDGKGAPRTSLTTRARGCGACGFRFGDGELCSSCLGGVEYCCSASYSPLRIGIKWTPAPKPRLRLLAPVPGQRPRWVLGSFDLLDTLAAGEV